MQFVQRRGELRLGRRPKRALALRRAPVTESGRRLTRLKLRALKGRTAEGIGLEKKLNNVGEDLGKTSGRPREDLVPLVLHFGKIPKKFGQNLAKVW